MSCLLLSRHRCRGLELVQLAPTRDSWLSTELRSRVGIPSAAAASFASPRPRPAAASVA